MNITADELSSYIVKKCIIDKHPVTDMQLQNILYCIQKEYLKTTGKPMFDDDFYAWAFGPVIPSVYYRYSGFGADAISFDAEVLCINTKIAKFIDPIIKRVRIMKPWDIVAEIHKNGGAWKEAYKVDDPSDKGIIPKMFIKEKG